MSRYLSLKRPSTLVAAALWAASLAGPAFAADPTIDQIHAKAVSGDIQGSLTMMEPVLKDHPNSAKAFYELGEVLAREGHNAEARQSLLRAEQIDPSLGFASSPAKFRELMDKLPATETRPAPVQAANAGVSNGGSAAATVAPAPAQRGGLPTWIYILLAMGGVWLVWRIASRLLSPPVVVMPAVGPGGGVAMGPNGPVGPMGPGYGPGGYGMGGMGMGGMGMGGGGMGLGGAALTGVAGAVAGYELAKAMEHGDQRGNYVDNNGYPGVAGGGMPSAPTPDYGSFDAGSGGNDSWDSGGGSDFGGGGGDDSW